MEDERKNDFISDGNVAITTVSGNAGTATKLKTARTISLSGDATGSASFDGSANKSISVTLASSGVTAGTYNNVTVDAKGRVTAGNNVSVVKTVNGTNADVSGNVDVYATIAPDLTAGVTVTSGFTAPSAGWLIGMVFATSFAEGSALINGKEFVREAQSYANFQVILSKGDVFTVDSSTAVRETYFYPFKGV